MKKANIKVFLGVLLFALCAHIFSQDLETDFTGQGVEPYIEHGDYVLRGTVLVQYRGWQEIQVVIPANLGITAIEENACGHSGIE
jgi:hypothetical protein